MKMPIKVNSVVSDDEVLWRIVDIEFIVDEIPFPTEWFKIVPIKWARLTNFETATILMARNLISKFPQTFQWMDQNFLARIFRDEFIETMSSLTSQWKFIFQALVDRPKMSKPQHQKIENLLDEMWTIEEDEGTIKHIEEFKSGKNIFKLAQEKKVTTPARQVEYVDEEDETDEEEVITWAYSEKTWWWKTQDIWWQKVASFDETSVSWKNITTYVIKPPKKKTVWRVWIPNPDAKRVKPWVYEKPVDSNITRKHWAWFKEH